MSGKPPMSHATRPGFATPGLAEPTGEPATQPLSPGGGAYDPHANTPIVEVEVLYQRGPAPTLGGPLHTVEVWTLNTVYILDPQLICIEARDRASGRVDAQNRFLGKRLVGGQHTHGESIELSFPFPRPGTEAVFELEMGRSASFGRTSTVVHVKLRMHVITVSPQVVAPTWAEIRTSLVPGEPEET